MFSGFPVEHRGAFAVHHQGAFPGIHGPVPPRPARAEGEFFGSQPQGLLDQAARKSHDVRALIHLGAGLAGSRPFTSPSAEGRQLLAASDGGTECFDGASSPLADAPTSALSRSHPVGGEFRYKGGFALELQSNAQAARVRREAALRPTDPARQGQARCRRLRTDALGPSPFPGPIPEGGEWRQF